MNFFMIYVLSWILCWIGGVMGGGYILDATDHSLYGWSLTILFVAVIWIGWSVFVSKMRRIM